MRPWIILGLFLSSALLGCAPKKSADLKTLDASAGGQSESSSLSPRAVSRLQELFTLYGSEHGLNRQETTALLQRFRPELLPLIAAALPEGEKRYAPVELMRALKEGFPPLAWMEKQDITDATGLRLALRAEFPEMPGPALADFIARIAPGGRTDPANLLKAGLAAAFFAKPSAGAGEALRTLALGKVAALYDAQDEHWASFVLGARSLATEPAIANENEKARALHHLLFAKGSAAEAEKISATLLALEGPDFSLDTELAAQTNSLVMASKILPLAMAHSSEGGERLSQEIPSERLYAWELLVVTDFLLRECQVTLGDPLSQEDLAVALFRIQSESKGSDQKFCPATVNAYGANFAERLLWRVRARLGHS